MVGAVTTDAQHDTDDDDEPLHLHDIGEDALLHLVSLLPSSTVSELASSSQRFREALGGHLETLRAAALKAFHDRHCNCSAAQCPWLEAIATERFLRLSFSCMSLDTAGTRLLLHLLRQRQNRRNVANRLPVAELVLDYASIEPTAIVALARGLPSATPVLSTLSLAGCDIDDTGAKALAQMVSSGLLRKLRELSLEDNPFSPAARYSVRHACRSHGVALSAYSEVENESLYVE